MNGLLPAARVPEGSCSLPHPVVKLVGDEIRTVWPHSAPGFFTEFVNADRAQDAFLDDSAPIFAVLVGPASGCLVVTEAWPSSLHQVSHDGIECYEPVTHIPGRAVAGHKIVVLFTLGVLNCPEAVN